MILFLRFNSLKKVPFYTHTRKSATKLQNYKNKNNRHAHNATNKIHNHKETACFSIQNKRSDKKLLFNNNPLSL